jgi:Kef-type K+ transport system membrane component KefB
MSIHIPTLIIVIAAATAAPLIAQFLRGMGIALVVFELSLGVLIGPAILGWAQIDSSVSVISTLGMAFLFFLAGIEVDFPQIHGQPIKLASASWLICFFLSIGLAYLGHRFGWIESWLVVGIAASTTALGILLPMLRDTGMLESPFGRHVMAAGVVGELGPIFAIALLLSEKNSVGIQFLIVLGFIITVLLLARALLEGIAIPKFLNFLRVSMNQSSQLPIRLSILILFSLSALAEGVGIDIALGALAAGMIVRFASNERGHASLFPKLDAIGFGFLVPIFFIASGMKLDVLAVVGSLEGLLKMGLFFSLILIVHIPMFLFGQRVANNPNALAFGLFSATTLSLIVAITDIATRTGIMNSQEASPLIMAGVVSVILCPAIAKRILNRHP